VTLDRSEVVDALPNYEVGSELGRGGWGVVLSGRHRQLDRQVAIKQLPRAFASDASVRARFVTEARLLASLDHPHIVPVYDFVERDGLCLLVMEQLPGGTVWTRFSTDGFTPPAAAAAVLATVAGLQAAHEHQILHRDMKPDNLMFSATGALKVTDFGIAKVVGGEGTLATRAGEVVGTPAYIAPEQARGGDLSPATDVYAVSTMFYELLCGQLPFADDADAMALLFKHAFEAPTPLRERAPFVPEVIADVVMRGLATDPGDRYATAQEFGLAVAEACTTAWGPGWLAAEGTPVIGANAIVSATDRVTAPPRPPTIVEPTVEPPVEPPVGPPARPATIADDSTATAPRPPTVADVGPPVTPAPAPPTASAAATVGAVVRPTIGVHRSGAPLADMKESDLVPVQAVLIPPARPTLPLVLAVVGLLVIVLVALLGIGSPATGGNLPKGSVTVAGIDPTSGRVITLDLGQPVQVTTASDAPAGDHARLTLQSVDQNVAQADAPLTVGPVATVPGASPDGTVAAIDVSSARYLAGGRLAGRIELLAGGIVVGEQRFGATTSSSGLLTAAGVVTLLLLMFVLAYAESFARSLRRGRRLTSATVGLGVIGAIVGVIVVALVWEAGIRSPMPATVAICALLGAGVGIAAAVASRRMGKGRRYARIQKGRAS
jgi:hypothetical protein